MFVKSQPNIDLAALLMGLGTDGAGAGKLGKLGDIGQVLQEGELEALSPEALEALQGEIDFANLLNDLDLTAGQLTTPQADATSVLGPSHASKELLTAKPGAKQLAAPVDVASTNKNVATPNVTANELQQLLKAGNQPKMVDANTPLQISSASSEQMATEVAVEDGVKIHKFTAKNNAGKKDIAELDGKAAKISDGGESNEEGKLLSFNREQSAKGNALNAYKKNAALEDKSMIRANVSMEQSASVTQLKGQGDTAPTVTSAGFQTVDSSESKKVGATVSKSSANSTTMTSNATPGQTIKQVSDYLMQVAASGKDSAEMTVKHQELGDIHVKVSKLDRAGDIAINIHTMRPEAHGLIRDNESQLIKNLSDAGIKVSEFKLNSGTGFSFAGDNKSEMNFGKDGQSKSFASFEQSTQTSAERREQSAQQDSQRRQAIWDMYRERMGA